MKYFFEVHMTVNRDNRDSFFIVSTKDTEEGIVPALSVDELKQCSEYTSFVRKNSEKVIVDYAVYSVDSPHDDFGGIDPANYKEHFRTLIRDFKANKIVANAEIEIIDTKKRGNPTKKKKKKISKMIIAVAAAISFIVGIIGGVIIGTGISTSVPIIHQDGDSSLEVGGMLIPESPKINPNAEVLTISIDLSYLAIPREDLQLKGEIINGVATITLPDFDRSDFFSHVPGHTWGFTSDPNGTKIEYYSGLTYNFTANMKLYRVLVKYGGGNGTKDDPYIIDYYDQLSLMSQEKVQGYFRQTANIEFPSWMNHTPIDTVNELKELPHMEYFEFDGGGFIISGLNAPLFGRVSGSLIQNVNVMNSVFETTRYGNYGFIISEAYNYRYNVGGVEYETGETLIRNCLVANSGITLFKPETDDNDIEPEPQFDEDGNEIPYVPPTKHADGSIGLITGLGGQIENCYVTNSWIWSNLDEYILFAGGISGKPASVTNSGILSLSITGNIFTAGGIVGSAGGSRLYNADGTGLSEYYGGDVQGCFVRDFTAYVEVAAGGIAGEASTNTLTAVISNAYVTSISLFIGVIEGEEMNYTAKNGFTGGIVGVDGNQDNRHIIANTISPIEYDVIGSSRISSFNEDEITVRIAPDYAFTQVGIFEVINRNTVHPDSPGKIFTGSYTYAEDLRNSDSTGHYPFPSEINDLIGKVYYFESEKQP